MKYIDCKCGQCNTVFPLNIEAYLKRSLNDSFSYEKNMIQCPSCNSRVPNALLDVILNLSYHADNDGWEIGTRFKD